MISVLNIAAGKILCPLNEEDNKDIFVVNLDTMYYNAYEPEDIESVYNYWVEKDGVFDPEKYPENRRSIRKMNSDAIEFMERTTIPFDKIVCYRYLEHVPFTNVLYFIYLMSTSLKIGGEVEIIVPDYSILARRILDEKVGSPGWEAENIITTTEIVNDPGCPHASIWTVARLEYFFELEKRFETVAIEPNFEFDGRDIYVHYRGRRVA